VSETIAEAKPVARVAPAPLTARDVYQAWWPLATSWLMMGLELPAVSAIMARLPDPTVSLAAYGGVVFPIALIIESPIIMFLSASTALSRDRASHRLGQRLMLVMAGSLAVLHCLVAFTPIFDFVAGVLLGVPDAVREPARLGLRIFAPWTFAIAYRRYQQGLLIRFGRSRLVGVGTAVRLTTLALVLLGGWAMGTVPGIVVGASAVVASVIAEAVFVALAVRPVFRDAVPEVDASAPPLTMRGYWRFYLPLAVTPVLLFLSTPLTSAAMSRMPRTLESLAVWPVIHGLVFVLRSVGFALNEVVIALLDRPGAAAALRRFAVTVGITATCLLAAVALSPIGQTWFARVAALPANLVPLARIGLLFTILLPALTAIMSFYQGVVVHARRTRVVTESMLVFLVVVGACLVAGIAWGGAAGIHVAMAATLLATVAQVSWLRARAGSA
jgi:hypothetical protein